MRDANLKSWLIWFTAGLFYLFEFIHRVDISVMIPELMESFNVSVAMLGGLSACYFYAYAFAQIPVGLLIDRYGTRSLLTIACLVISLSSFVFSITNSIIIAGICRIFIGFGSAFAFVGCLKIGATWFPKHRFSFIVGLTNLLGVTGAIIGGRPIAYVVETYSWQCMMLASAIIGFALTVLLAGVLRDKLPRASRSLRAGPYKIRAVFKPTQIWLVAAFGGFMVAPIVAYSELWGVSYLVNYYQIDRPLAAQITTLTFAGIALGGPIIGWFAEYFRARNLTMLLGTIGAACSISTILLVHNVPLFLLYMLHFSFGFFTSSMLLCFSINSQASKSNMRATTIALTNTIIMAMGALLQTICGELLNYTDLNYEVGFSPVFVCYALALITLLCLNKARFSSQSIL